MTNTINTMHQYNVKAYLPLKKEYVNGIATDSFEKASRAVHKLIKANTTEWSGDRLVEALMNYEIPERVLAEGRIEEVDEQGHVVASWLCTYAAGRRSSNLRFGKWLEQF